MHAQGGDLLGDIHVLAAQHVVRKAALGANAGKGAAQCAGASRDEDGRAVFAGMDIRHRV